MRRVLAAAVFLLALTPALAMDNPGPLALQLAGGDFALGAAATQIGTPQAGLAGMTSLSLQVDFNYGSSTGSPQTNVYVVTSLDQGATWFDVANIEFTTASTADVVNLSAASPLTTPTAPSLHALTNNTVLNGPLGDRLRVDVVVSGGTYGGNSLVSVRAVVR
jgi:hypothetical protein